MASIKKISDKIMRENMIKNFVIIILGFLFYSMIKQSLLVITPDQIGDFLLVISILLVTVCFANFAFTYDESKMNVLQTRLLSHSATFIFMLLIVLLLETMVISIGIVYPSLFGLIFMFSVLLYIGIVLYDAWDLLRILTD